MDLPLHWINNDVLRRSKISIDDRFPRAASVQSYESNDVVQPVREIQVLGDPVKCH